jgi:hypothetical protein
MIAPYVTSGPVTGTEFYGRERLISEILGGSQRATFVLGTRQSGKTSLLRQVETLVPSLFLDVQWAGGQMENLVRQACREVRRKRRHHDWLPPENTLPLTDLFSLLETVNDMAETVSQRIWVLVDEAEGLLEPARSDPEVLHRLRGTIQNCPALRVVLVAAKALSEANDLTATSGSPFLSGFALRYLGGLSPGASAALLRRSQGPTSVAVDDALVTRLIYLTNGHPLLLQSLGERLFEDGQLRHPTQGDLDAIFDQCAKTAIFEKDFAYLTDVEREVLHALVEGKLVPADVDSVFLYGLTQLGYLRREGDGYVIGNAFFGRWLGKWADWQKESQVSEESTQAVYEQSRLEQVLALVEEDRLSLAEIRRTLDAIRRAMTAWQQYGLPADVGTRHTLEKIEAALASRGGPKHKLEATLPLLPLVLAYKVEWGGEISAHLDKLRAALDELEARFPGEEPDGPQE